MSSTADAGAPVPLDTTPDYPPADPARVRSAVEALSQVLRNLPRQEFPGTAAPGHGQRVARADDLVTAVAADGHEPAAAAWAVHECVRAGWLIPEVRNEEVEVGGREEIDRNSILVRAERYFGTHGRVPTVRIPGRMVPRPTFTGSGPVPFDCLLVRTTPAFWERPGRADGGEAAPSPQSGSARPTPPGGDEYGPSPPNAGFPHYGRYLPDGYNHSFRRLWPDAERQLRRFEQAVEVANRKLPVGTRLPGELVQWWYRHWAGELMARIGRPAGSAAEVRALYTFGRELDRLLSLSTSPLDEPHPRDIEFTFYDRDIRRDDGRGNIHTDPLSSIRRNLLEERMGLAPSAFPGRTVPHHAIGWRLSAEGFLDWAGFLCMDGELAEGQREVLTHIAYCTRGENDWCQAFGTHGEQCRPLGDNLLRRIQDDIVRVSDELRIEVRTIGRAGTFRESLDDVSRWLVQAEAASRSQPAEEVEADTPLHPAPPPRNGAAVAAVLELIRELRNGLGLLEALQRADTTHFSVACRGWLGWLDRAVVRMVRSTGGGEDSLGSPGLRELYQAEVRRHPVCPRTAGFAAVRALLGEDAERQVRALTTRGTDLRPTPDGGPEQLTRPAGEPGRSVRVVLQWYRETVNLLEAELVARGLWAPEGQGIPGSDSTTGSSSGPTEASHTFSGRVSGGGVGVKRVRALPLTPPDRRSGPGGLPEVPAPVRSWLQARYMSDPTPDRISIAPQREAEPVVFVPFDRFADFLNGAGYSLLPTLEACRAAGLIEDMRIDLFECHGPTETAQGWLMRCVERLQLAVGQEHRLVAIRRNVLGLPSEPPTVLPPKTPAGAAVTGMRGGGGVPAKPADEQRDPRKPGADRQADIIGMILEKNTPLMRSELVAALKLKTEGKLGANLAWLVDEGILVNIPQRGYWPADRPVPE